MNNARATPQAVRLSETAVARMREIVGDKAGGVRLAVKGGGCAGFSYVLDLAEAPTPGDEVIEQDGVALFVDGKSLLYLIGTEIDFVREQFGARFVFNNPNQTAACGCGESVALTPKAD